MKRFWLRVKNDESDWFYVFDCEPKKLNELWEFADFFARKGYMYKVDIVVEDVKLRDEEELPF